MITAQSLFDFARFGIESRWEDRPLTQPKITPALAVKQASFVTLNLEGKLRGCVGSLVAHAPLWQDLETNGFHAAFKDYRFRPLSLEEYQEITLEISLLTHPQPVKFSSKEELQQIIRPEIDGIIYSCMGKRATFLPQVWENLPDFDQFFSHLSQKAGLGEVPLWEDCSIERYQVELYHE